MKQLFQSRLFRLTSLWLVAISSGALAMIAARAYLDDQIRLERSKLEQRSDRTVSVVVAKFELQRGDVIDSSSMAVREVPSQYLPSSAVNPSRFDALVGARLGRGMRSGEPLLLDYLKTDDDNVGLSDRLKPGARAVTINVDEVNALSGMLQPGDRIDLLMSARGSELSSRMGASREVTVPLIQDALVLATGKQVAQTPDADAKGRIFTSITLELAPEQAQRLVTAQRGGRLTAMLRAQGDRVAYQAKPIDLDQILGVAAVASPPARLEPVRTELIVGGSGSLTQGAQSRASSTQAAGSDSAEAVGSNALTVSSSRVTGVEGAAGLSSGGGARAARDTSRLAERARPTTAANEIGRPAADGATAPGPILIR